MTEEKDVKQSSGDIAESVKNDPVNMNMEMVSEKVTVDKKNVEEKQEGVVEEEDEEDEEEEQEEDEEEEVEVEVEDVEEEEEEEDEETESEEDTEDEQENKTEPGPIDVSIDGEKVLHVEVSLQKNHDGTEDSPINGVEPSKSMHAGSITASPQDGDKLVSEASAKNNARTNQKLAVDDENGSVKPDTEEVNNAKSNAYDSIKDKKFGDETMSRNRSSLKAEHMKEELKDEARIKEGTMDEDGKNPSESLRFDSDTSGGGESGTEEEQVAFVRELDKFHKQRSLDFRPPKFYGGPLNLLKLWRAVMKLGGYDKVTACKYWRQVGESFKPPKTCTTVSWTFRIFYEKALLDYERYRASIDGSSIPGPFAVAGGAENQASGSGRARRESAARAMQGWHSQRILDNGEVSDPIIKDKNSISSTKKEKHLKNLGIPKRKKPSSTDLKSARTKLPKTQTEMTVIDIGSPADWVKINVRVTKDCYEVYALVPGLLREEVRVQSDPAGRLVISGEPENPDNPWSVTPFKKVVSLPSRIDPHQTSAVVTLHGQLFVRVPFEQYD